jgi:ABC-type amino acid transport/signal transduction systems, periplasmic component/domain
MKRNKRIIWSIIGLIVVVLVLTGVVIYSQSNLHASGQKAITIATAGTIFPNAYRDNKKLTGYDVQVVEAIAKAEGYSTKFITTDFDGIFGQIDSGRVDTIANDIGITPERVQKYKFSIPYNRETTNIAVKNSSSYKTLRDLEGKTVATSGAGNNFIKSLQKYDPKINIKVYETRDQAIQSLITGRVDGLLYSRASLSAIIKHQNLSWRVVNGDASATNVAFPFTNNNKKMLKVFNDGLKKITANGTLNKISTKYFGYDVTGQLKK